MKNSILDDIFHDNLRDNLEEGEVVTWDGKPQFNNYSRLVAAGFIFIFIGVHFFNSIRDENYWMTAFTAIGMIISFVQLFFRQKKTRYLITNQRIIFQLPKMTMRGVEVHSLPFEQLDEVIIKEKGSKSGTIELILKKTFNTKIKTFDIRKSSNRKHPTLELIEDVEEVRNYIIEGINSN